MGCKRNKMPCAACLNVRVHLEHNPSTRSDTHATSSRGGGKVQSEICLRVCFSVCLQFNGTIDRRTSCLKWWCYASEAADVMCHPFVTSAFSNPSQQALPLCDCCYACGLPQYWDCVCVCVCVCAFMQEFVCTCVLLPWQIYSNPGLPASIGGDGGGEGGGSRALWKTPLPPLYPAAFSPLLHSPADIFLEPDWMN